MNILGISCYYHDSAAALIKDGKIIAACEEERFSRIKHDSSFPKKAIDFCLALAKITTKDLDYVVFYEKPFKKFHRILISTLSTFPHSLFSFREAMRVWMTKKIYIKSEIASYLNIPEQKILFSEHHLSHAASTFYPSPFKEAAVLTVDGVGEWATAAFAIGKSNKLNILKEIYYPQSLGLLYSVFTAFLGFEVNEGEWKVMGLAPYGKPVYEDKIWKIVQKNRDGSFSLDFTYFSYQYSDSKAYSKKFIELFGSPIQPSQSHLITKRNAGIAASIQKVCEEILLNMAKNLKKLTGLQNLCIAGGVALNSVANYRLLKESGFKNIFIQPASGDSGGALGAAFYVYHHVLNKEKRSIQTISFFGQKFSNEEIKNTLLKFNVSYKNLPNDKLVDFVSNKLKNGYVIAWFQDKFEWGPRALGHRSILADPRNPNMKDIINSKVKFRESFRPFAPSVLADQASKVFELPTTNYKLLTNHYPLRFMLYVVPVIKEWIKKVPAITHADNTARPQLVYKQDNRLYYELIASFYKKTGVPLILNTSFNLKGEPIVASPSDAYSTFMRSGIDFLVLGNYVCEK